MSKRYIVIFVLALFMSVASFHSLYAQESVSDNTPVASTTYEINSVSDLYKKSDEISEDSRNLEKKLQSLVNVSDIDKNIRPLRESLNEYKQKFKDAKGAENTDIESMITLRGNIKIISDICLQIKSKVEDRLKNIATLNKDWLDKREYWEQLHQQSNFVNNKTAKDIFIENDKIIDEALKLFDGVDTPVTNLNQKLSDFNVDKNLFCKLMAALVFRGRYYDAEKAARFIFGEKWADEAGQSEEMTFLRSVLDMVEAYQDQEYDLLKERVEIIGEEIGKTIPDYVRAVFALQQNGLVDKSEQELLQMCDGILEIMPENYDVMKVKGDLLAESGREAEAKAHHEKVYYNSRNGLDVLELDRRYSFADRYAIYNEKDL